MRSQSTISKPMAPSPRKEALAKAIRFAIIPFLFVTLVASSSQAQQRTFVSGLGRDTDPCTRTAPCRTFGRAISLTNPGGEVYVLDGAGYGPFAINQAVSIVAPPGVTAGISVFSGDGIDINAGASDIVILRGLTINSQGTTGNGILFTAGATLHVENCVVNGFSTSAGLVSNSAGHLEVKDSVFRGNLFGIDISPSSGAAKATIDQVRLESGGWGLVAEAGSNVTVRNSLASGNTLSGFAAVANAAPAELNIENCVSSNNEGGISARAVSGSTQVATARVSNSAVTDNFGGLVILNGGVILSRGNNTIEGNNLTVAGGGTLGSYVAH